MENQELQESQEIQLSDGQTDNLPPLPEISQAPEDRPGDSLPSSSATTTNNDGLYTQGEFESAFNEFLTFLKSPETSVNAFEALRAEGQALAAGKIYQMAQDYKFLRWIIDRKTRLFHDMALIGLFVSCETNAIIQNWTGISIFEKGKIWLKEKIKARQAQAAKRKGWGFLGRPVAAKQPKQEL